MKFLLVLLTSMFSIVILLIAGFQLVRLLLNGLTDMVIDAWHHAELPSSH